MLFKKKKYQTNDRNKIIIDIDDSVFVPIGTIPNLAYEAISLLHDGCDEITQSEGLILPEIIYDKNNQNIINFPFVYNFKTKTRSSNVNIQTNGIYPYRITDATDMDECSNLWILSLNRFEEDPYNNEKTNFRSIIKAHYSERLNTLVFMSKYDIPNSNSTQGTPNFEGLVQVSKNIFIIFSDGFSVFNGQGIVAVTIRNNQAQVDEIKISVNGNVLTNEQYDELQISTAFNTKDGIIFVPQNPEKLTSNVYTVSNKEICGIIEQLEHTKNSLVMNAKNIKIEIHGDKRPGSVYEGIEAMTIDKHKNIYGLTEWSSYSNDVLTTTFSRPFNGKLIVNSK